MDFSTVNMWSWLIPLLIGAICGILGYLIGKGKETIDNSVELKALHDMNSKLQSDLDACNEKWITKPNNGENVSSSMDDTTVAMATTAAFDATVAKTILGKAILQDDLKVVEGIGPKIAGMFHKAGIKTWKALSETSVASCQEILNTGGERYKVHDPASWPMQARMCYEGKWKELFKWQEEHHHGKL